jgi:hypothetical protein
MTAAWQTTWEQAIERQRLALVAIVAGLFAMLRIADGDVPERTLPRLRRLAYRILQPAESACRRLIYAAARDLKVTRKAVSPKGQAKRGRQVRPSSSAAKPRAPRLAFPLFDRRKSFSPRKAPRLRAKAPRIAYLGHDPTVAAMRAYYAPPPPAPPAPVDDGLVDARRLTRRLLALQAALGNLPAHAKRLARWRARPVEARRPRAFWPFRPGAPPGHRATPRDEVDYVLRECDWLASKALKLDTS